MPQTVLVANTGRPTGSAASRRLRAQDHIPGVLYGHGMAPVSVTVGRRDLRLALSGGAGYIDGSSLARAYRDVRAGSFMHPLGANRAYDYLGRVALGEDPSLH